MERPRFDLLGDRALLVTLSSEISESVNDRVLTACERIELAGIPGIEEAQPAYSSFCVHFDPSKVGSAWLKAFVEELLASSAECVNESNLGGLSSRTVGREVEIPVVYGGDKGPDLSWASEHLGLTPEEIIHRHSQRRYRVYMIGFAPGFPYLGGMDESIALPRLPTPRTSVPPGSVAIGGKQTGVYPWESPGGWRIIGRTPATLFSPGQQEPSLLLPGDMVRFVPADRSPAGAHSEQEREGAETSVSAARSSFDLPWDRPSAPALVVEHPGLLSFVVDEGRRGFRRLGVPLSGAADLNSYTLANLLCGNPPGTPAVEMTLWGARLRAIADVVVAVTGAHSPLMLDGACAPMNKPVFMREGSVLEVGSPKTGCRMYLAASGGFSVPRVMNSASTYLRGLFGGFEGRRLLPGDTLRSGPGLGPEELCGRLPDLLPGQYESRWPVKLSWQQTFAARPERLEGFCQEQAPVLRIIPGPEARTTEGEALLEALCSQVYTVRSDSDRMGVRFSGTPLDGGRGTGDIVSSPVIPGIIQVPSDGMPVLLLCDAQTCGGYRRVAAVMSEDLPLAGQMRPGFRVRFECRATS